MSTTEASHPMPPPLLIRSPLLSRQAGIVHAFTARASPEDGPQSSVGFDHGVTRDQALANRQRILSALGREDATWISIHQVHGDAVVQVTESAGRTIEADGLWTRDHDAAPAILTADCLPVLMTDKTATFVAAVHAGWRGTKARIVARAVERLVSQGIKAADLLVALGPAIGPCCFEIGPEVASELAQAYPTSRQAIGEVRGRTVADLWALNRVALEEAGVSPESIDEVRLCTHCDARFFSHRRDQGKTGRQAGVIAFAAKGRGHNCR